jgi:hypothetical protein
MDDDATAFALCLYLWRRLGRFEAACSFKRVEGKFCELRVAPVRYLRRLPNPSRVAAR